MNDDTEVDGIWRGKDKDGTMRTTECTICADQIKNA